MNNKPGQSLIEVLLALSILVLGLSTIVVLVIAGVNTQRNAQETGKALIIAQEGLEAARSIRDFAFVGLTAGNHGVAISGNRWVFSGASDTSEDFTRTVSVRSIDAYKKYVTSTVSWEFRPGQTKSVVLSTLIANWRDKRIGKKTLLVSDGALDLPGNADGIGLAVSGTKAYVGRANTAESEFIVVDVSNTAAPFTLAELDMSANLNDLATYGTYVYGASGVQLAEIQIIDVSSSTNPFVVNTIDLAGNGDAQSVVVSGTRMYVTRESHGANPTFYVFDLATSSTAPTILGSLNLGSGAEDVALADSSSYAYIASHHDAQEFQVVNTVNPASMLVGGYWDELNDKDNFQGVAVSGTIAYAGSLTRITAGEFFVMNIANPLSPTNLSSLEIGAHVYSVRVPEDKGAVIIGSASSTAELMLIDASDPVNPVIIDKKDHAGEINDLVIVGDHVYTVTGYDALEFRVFQIE